MKNRGKNLALVLTGVLIGGAVGSPAAFAASEYLQATRSVCPIFVDGGAVELEAYLINGNNYVKLRDVGEAVGFNVYWDGQAARIESDKPYTGEPPVQDAPTWDEPLQSAGDENPAVFDGTYTREAYAALRQTVVTGGESPGVAMSEGTRIAMREAAAAIGSWPRYDMITGADGTTVFRARYPDSYEGAVAYCRPFVNGLAGTDAERVRQIAFYVCDRLTYSASATATPNVALAGSGVSSGNCMSYAHCFKTLCDLAGIPCILVHSDTHQWNLVYVDGQWWNVDVAGADIGDDPNERNDRTILHPGADMQGRIYQLTQPELTAFAKELLVPGSSK